MTAEPPEDAAVHVALPDDPSAPRLARERARSVLGRWRLPGLLEPLLLVVSELVGNAVRHGSAPIALLLRRTGAGVRVEVHDEAPEAVPEGASELPDHDAESGRGLFLVQAVSQGSGVQQIESDGKVVWADLEDAQQP